MRILRLGWFTFLVAGLLTPALPLLASSQTDHDHCTCAQSAKPVDVAFAEAEAVFVGAVIDLQRPNERPAVVKWANQIPGVQIRGFSVWRATLAVSDSWKGVTTTTVTVRTRFGVDCGFDFDSGGQYLIYAYHDRDGLTTDVCTRSVELTSATSDLTYLQSKPKLALGWPLDWYLFAAAAIASIATILGFGLRWIKREMTSFEH